MTKPAKKYSLSLRLIVTTLALTMVFCFLLTACGGSKEPAPDPAKDKGEAAKPAEPPKAPEAAKTAETPAPAEKVNSLIEKASDTKMETLVEKSKEAKAQEPYSYDPINKVDPFSQSSTTIELPSAGGKDENILTKYEIRYFRLVGIILDEAQPRAIFEDPKGHAYVVAVGTPIGRNLGVIEQIQSDSVIVTEQRFIPGGTDIENVQLVIKLHPNREKEAQGGG